MGTIFHMFLDFFFLLKRRESYRKVYKLLPRERGPIWRRESHLTVLYTLYGTLHERYPEFVYKRSWEKRQRGRQWSSSPGRIKNGNPIRKQKIYREKFYLG